LTTVYDNVILRERDKMAFDIYGGRLLSGHCEVHPHIHEEYPCSICIQERKLKKKVLEAVEEATYEEQCRYEEWCQAEILSIIKNEIGMCLV